jgi:hypothetical protein
VDPTLPRPGSRRHPRASRVGVPVRVLDNAQYIEGGDSLFSTEIVKNRSPRSSCSVPASSSATSTTSILYVSSLTSALITVMSRSAPA